MRFVFWKNIPSMHESAFLRSLATPPNNDVTLIVSRNIINERMRSGWVEPDFGQIDIITSPDLPEIRRLIRNGGADTIHIFCGVNSEKMVRQAYMTARQERIIIGLMSERSFGYPSPRKLLTGIRDMLQAPFYSKHLAFFLAMGTLGVEWYKNVGYPSSKLYPFGYFTENHTSAMDERPSDLHIFPKAELVQVLFIGDGIHRKGLDILLQALGKIQDRDWELHIIGKNTTKDEYQRLCSKLQISSRIKFHGVLRNDNARGCLENVDLLVLPSRFDGWGAVINESLMHGVPVICSDRCGAKDLLANDWRGSVFPSGSVSALSQLLDTWITRGKLTSSTRKKIINWSEYITGEYGAKYFLEIIQHVKGFKEERPQAPWLG